MAELAPVIETIEGEHLKTLAEFGLHSLSKMSFNEQVFRFIRGGERIQDARLRTNVAGLELENPLMVGAGWDKRGWAVDGLYALGFSATEVGSVLVHPQKGNPKPRIFYESGTGLNRLGFNSKGQEAVAAYLDTQKRPGVVGISLGKNKLTPDDQAPWAHAAVAERLYKYADYFVVNVASPNTPGLRGLLKTEPMTEIVKAVKAVTGTKPLFIKTTVDLALADLDQILQICIDQGVGIIDSNTTIDEELKRAHGWAGEMGGLSGSDPAFRKRATERMRYITKQTRYANVARIGVGGINDTESALERIQAGAQAIQVVTGIRQRKGRIAQDINAGLTSRMNQDNVENIREYVGVSA